MCRAAAAADCHAFSVAAAYRRCCWPHGTRPFAWRCHLFRWRCSGTVLEPFWNRCGALLQLRGLLAVLAVAAQRRYRMPCGSSTSTPSHPCSLPAMSCPPQRSHYAAKAASSPCRVQSPHPDVAPGRRRRLRCVCAVPRFSVSSQPLPLHSMRHCS